MEKYTEEDLQDQLLIKGKVRNVYTLDNDKLAMFYSDRLSCFDQIVCHVPQKGSLLNKVCAWWFQKTKHIIPNHFISLAPPNGMIVKKCQRFNIEVVVRAYITGSTLTSLWTQYNNGVRNYCGIQFPDGLVKNQKLAQTVVTPTTKSDVHDEPISPTDIVNRGLASAPEWTYISNKAIELFEYAADRAASKGLILVDTKYEFGKDKDQNIILIDEIHTMDSSRWWIKDTFEERFKQGLEPQRFDKDIIRYYVKNICDPYKDEIPEIPKEMIHKVQSSYAKFAEMLMK